jgi:hypothetical protein
MKIGHGAWRCSYDAALRPVETPLCDNGRYLIRQGAMAAVCAHEASHAVAVVSMGGRIEQIEVGLRFQWYYDGKTLVKPHGMVTPEGADKGDGQGDTLVTPSSVPLDPVMPFCCFNPYLKDAIVSCAGPAGELKYRAQGWLPRETVCVSDIWALERYKRLTWLMTGRDGDALVRLAWRKTLHLMDVPVIWRAVQAVKAELFSGLLRLEPADHQAGDSIKFTLPGEDAEQLMVRAGIVLPHFISQHQCGPECIKPSRRTSRRWERYLAEWAAEAPKNAA